MRLLPLLLLLLLPGLLFGQNKKEKKLYSAYIVSGDSAFNVKNYGFAKSKYKLAAEIKPKEAYPVDRMALCDKMIITQGIEYKKWILKADSCYQKQDWENAKTYYLKAVDAKPFEQYPNDQAKNCNYQIVSRQAVNDLYNDQIRRGDSCYKAKSWSCAKANYDAAARTKPEQEYPKKQSELCSKQITPVVNKERYDITISDADRQFDAGNYARAKELYQEALQFNPGAKYAVDRLKLCDDKMNAPK